MAPVPRNLAEVLAFHAILLLVMAIVAVIWTCG